MRIWDVATGRLKADPIPFDAAQVRIALSPDATLVAILPVGTKGGPAKVWEIATGQFKATEVVDNGRDQEGTAVAFAPDGKSWAMAGGQSVHVLPIGPANQHIDLPNDMETSSPIRSMAFAPDGKHLAVGLLDGRVTLPSEQDNRKETTIFRSPNNAVEALVYSPDGRSIAIGGTDRVVRIIDVERETVRLTLLGHRRPITGLSFSPDGKLLASSSDGEPALFVWDVASGDVVSNPTLPDASSGEGLACLTFSPDGKALYAAGERGVTTFDMTEGHRPPSHVARSALKKGKERATLRGHTSSVRSLAFAEGGSKLVTRGEDGLVKVWDLHDGDRDRQTFGRVDFKVQSMALHPDGKTLATGLRLPDSRLKAGANEAQAPQPEPPPREPGAPVQKMGDEVMFWDIETGEGRGMIAGKATNGGTDRVVALAYTRDGKTLATTSLKGAIRIWDVDTLASKVDLAPREVAAQIVQFSSDGKTLLGADASGKVTLWDAEAGSIRAIFAHSGGMNQVLLSPDGKVVATAGSRVPPPASNGSTPTPIADFGPGSGGDVRLWDPVTGERVAVLPMPSGKVTRLAFSRDGKTLAASTTGAVATVWDVESVWDAESAVPIVTLAWPSGEAKYLAFSPDGKLLATGGDDETLRVWDIATGSLCADLLGHTDAINWVAFSPDGRTIATASRDTTVKLWDVPTP